MNDKPHTDKKIQYILRDGLGRELKSPRDKALLELFTSEEPINLIFKGLTGKDKKG